ncbi:hypothetical protein [Candidatus Electronema sp. PJ]|uniref:hypothetical protein n=1 Tax=Candidatus Electronema sp. PJ TaxID=3401572 RepID=UPI003AA8D8A8
MKTMNKKITGIAAAALLLTGIAGSVYAADVCCTDGTVHEAGASFRNFDTGFAVGTTHGVKLTCESGLTTNPDWTGTPARYFELPGTPKDAMLATALTALADDKKVKFCLANAKDPSSGTNVNGHVKSIYVTTTAVTP